MDLSKWADDYINSLQGYTPVSSGAPTNALSLARAAINSPTTQSISPAQMGFQQAAPPDNSPGLGSRILDILSRPLYAVGSAIQHDTDQFEGKTTPYDSGLGAAWAGFTGKSKVTPGDVITRDMDSGPLKFIASLGSNIGLDPLTYVPLGPAIRPLASLYKKTRGVTTTVDDAAKAAAARKLAETDEPVPTSLVNELLSSNRPVGELTGRKPLELMPGSTVTPYRTGTFTDTGPAALTVGPSASRGVLSPSPAVRELETAHQAAARGSEASFVTGPNGETAVNAVLNPLNEFQQGTRYLEDQFINIDSAIRGSQVRRYPGNPVLGDVSHIISKTTGRARRNPKEMQKWLQDNSSLLRPDDIAYIRAARTPESMSQRIQEVRVKGDMPETPLSSIEQWVEHAQNGTLTPDSIANVLRATGTSSISEVVPRVTEMINMWRGAKEAGTETAKAARRANSVEAGVARAASESEATISKAANAARASEVVAEPIRAAQVTEEGANALKAEGVINKSDELANPAVNQATEVLDGNDVFSARMARRHSNDPEGYAEALSRVRQTEEAGGRYRVIRSTPNTNITWDVTHADIARIIPNTMTTTVLSNAANKIGIAPLSAGVAKSLDLSASTLPASTLVDEVATTIRNSISKSRTIDEKQLMSAAQDIVAHHDEFVTTAAANMAARSGKDTADAFNLADAATVRVVHAMESPQVSTAEAIETLANMPASVRTDAISQGASPTAYAAATAKAAEAVAETTPKFAPEYARMSTRVANDLNAGRDAAKIQERVMQETGRAADDAEAFVRQADEAEGNIFDLDRMIAVRQEGRLAYLLNGIGKGVLQINTKGLRDIYRTEESVAQAFTTQFRGQLNRVAKQYSGEEVGDALSALRRGTTGEGLPAYEDLKQLWDLVHDTSGKKGTLGALFRNGVPLEQVNEAMKLQGIKAKFETGQKVIDSEAQGRLTDEIATLTASKQTAATKARVKALKKELAEVKKGRDQTMDEVADQWRTSSAWDKDYENPLLHLHRMFSALQHLSGRQVVGHEFTSMFGVKSIPSGAKPGEWVKLTGEKSRLLPFINKDLYYPVEAATKLRDLEKFMAAAVSFRGDKGVVAATVNNLVDPAMAVFKPWVTIARVGHHFRNVLGELSAGMLDGVYNPSHYRNAARIYAAGRGTRASAADFAAHVRGEARNPNAAKTFTTAPIGGKSVALSDDEIYKLFDKNGLFPDYTVREDIFGHETLSAADTKTDKIRRALTENPYMAFMGQVSEVTSHVPRSAHAMALLSRPSFTNQFKTLDDAVAAAAVRVKRFHPDVTGLSPFEQKYMRRIFPFYSWIRQAIPVLFTTMLTNPGRALQVPKAIYAMAQANGINMDSFSDPWPDDQIYPSFITENLTGPVFGDTSLNLGSITEGVLGGSGTGLLNGNPIQNVTGMLNPLIKMPVELTSGRTLGTGAYIADKGQYFDSITPVANQIANLSGISPWGSVANTVSGNGPMLDPQRAVAKGDKDYFEGQSIVNWLLGLGLTDTKRPSYQQFAIKEMGGQ